MAENDAPTAREFHRLTRKTLAIWLKPVVILSAGTLACVLFTAGTPPALPKSFLDSFSAVTGLSGPAATYWLRFALSLTLLGVFPLAIAIILRLKPRELGLRIPAKTLGSPLFLASLPLALLIGAAGANTPELAAYYPYARDLLPRTGSGQLPMGLHLAAYLVLYYLPWEFFFRGFLLFPIARLSAGGDEGDITGTDVAGTDATGTDTTGAAAAIAFAVLFQTLPSTLLHFGHPLTELLSAIPAGIIFGILAWKTKSFIPSLILHALIGFGTDLAIFIGA